MFCGFIVFALMAVGFLPRPAAAQPDLLHPRQAFVFAASLQEEAVRIEFLIEPGYYMYRERFSLFDAAGVVLPIPEFPSGQMKSDEFFGEVEIYRREVAFEVPVQTDGRDLQLQMVSQGCADIGVCFPPERVTLAFSAAGGAGRIVGDYSVPDFALSDRSGAFPAAAARAGLGDSGRAFAVLSGQPLVAVLAAFFGFGLLLSFTPCVLPMVPIVLSIVTGGRNPPSAGKAGALCALYVVSTAAVYAMLGVAAAVSGQLLSYYLQHPAVAAVLAALFALLGVSMIGVFELRLLPAALSSRMGRLRGAQGSWLGAAVFGATSAIVVSPCVAAPLVGALLFISQSRDLVLGGSALAFLGLGMGALPLAAATGASVLLPKAGPLSGALRILFGLMMFAVAIWLLAALVPAPLRMAGYALLGFAAVLVLAAAAGRSRADFPRSSIAAAGVAVVAGLGSAVMAVGAYTGAVSEFAPLSELGSEKVAELEFVTVADVDELDSLLADSDGRSTMIEFTADWCVSCREIKAHVFTDPQVARRLAKMRLLRVDVTEVDGAGRALLDRFGLFGPPAMIFFDDAGIEQGRVLGFQSAGQFVESLAALE